MYLICLGATHFLFRFIGFLILLYRSLFTPKFTPLWSERIIPYLILSLQDVKCKQEEEVKRNSILILFALLLLFLLEFFLLLYLISDRKGKYCNQGWWDEQWKEKREKEVEKECSE